MMKFHKVFQAYNAFIRHSDLSPAPRKSSLQGQPSKSEIVSGMESSLVDDRNGYTANGLTL